MQPKLAQRLAHVVDPAVRQRYVARDLQTADAHEVVEAIEFCAMSSRDSLQRGLYLSFLQLILTVRPRPNLPGGPLPLPDRERVLADARVALLIGAATQREFVFTARLLRDAFAPPTVADAHLIHLHPSVEKIPLGTRRERARSPSRDQLAALLLDTTPSVVQILAENPRTLQAHAMQMATLRPTNAWALQAILMSLRWLSNELICESCMRNQAAPAWLVLALAPLVPSKIQLSVLHLPWINVSVRALLARWLGLADQMDLEQEVAEPVVYELDVDGEVGAV